MDIDYSIAKKADREGFSFLIAILQIVWGAYFSSVCIFGMSLMWGKFRVRIPPLILPSHGTLTSPALADRRAALQHNLDLHDLRDPRYGGPLLLLLPQRAIGADLQLPSTDRAGRTPTLGRGAGRAAAQRAKRPHRGVHREHTDAWHGAAGVRHRTPVHGAIRARCGRLGKGLPRKATHHRTVQTAAGKVQVRG